MTELAATSDNRARVWDGCPPSAAPARADLTDAYLFGADLTRASPNGTHLTGAQLTGASSVRHLPDSHTLHKTSGI